VQSGWKTNQGLNINTMCHLGVPGSTEGPVGTVLLSHWPVRAILGNSRRTKMVSIFILAFSVIALVRFAIAQWRAIWLSTANNPLSDALQLTTGTDGSAIGAQDFSTLMDLCDKFCPDLKKTSPWLREVSIYYRLVLKLEQVFQSKVPRLSIWARNEMQSCSRYVAVLLDQSLSMSLDRRLAASSN
jgi:hypothetical protein